MIEQIPVGNAELSQPFPVPSQGSRALAALRAINAVISSADEERQLLQEVCKAIVDVAGYRSARVVCSHEGSEAPLTVAASEASVETFEQPEPKPDNENEEKASVTEAILQGRPDVGPLAVLPLTTGSPELASVLLIEGSNVTDFDQAELELLQEAARSLAHSLSLLHSLAEYARARQELHRVNRARKTLSAVNRALVRAEDEPELLGEICRIIAAEGGYRNAWVGYALQNEAKDVQLMAHVGVDLVYLDSRPVTWADDERGHGAVGNAIRSGQPSIGRNVLNDPDMAPWREELQKRGCAAVSAFPLRVDGEVIGALALAAGEADAFDAPEADLLGELADDLAFGIENLRMRERSRQAAATVKRMAEQDNLTGLPNRWRLRMRLIDEIAAAKVRNGPIALLMLGIDHFQEVNETLGYQQGDGILCEIAARISRVVGDTANIARMGEAEFAILLPNSDAGAASRTAQRILNEMLEPVEIGEITLDAGGRIGIAVFPGHGTDPDAIIRRANVAMHQARQQGQRQALYTGGRDRECARRLALIGDMHRAINKDELQLYCQPKVRFSNREICGAEALVRWQHPQLGMIAPEEFIGLAEHSGLISSLTDWVMQAAFRQSYAWREAGLRLPLAVNLSARDLRDPKLVERVCNLFATWGADPEGIQFELTESALMQDPRGSLDTMKRLKDLGIELFIDDFGTGYSSLAYLQKLPVDAIKIDKSFVHDMLSDADSAVIVRSTIDLAHDLDMEIVAEGVEDRAIWSHLAAQGCDIAQGYVVSQPIPTEAYAEWRSAGAFELRIG
ncbi:putative bifunctional diguanylate cyclase/phosphodiesterase [Noviherbaspirillum saxi]|uniref:GGDEF domain-containing protein n=1 Tax=Noviherbaspirillum saxi TaxID=2320863 RepID=A0A3A3G4Q2_9BURK|nr:GGDEF domain-containing protein [Noviherbaspirillum saxi]RJF95170.1 GGDEF domain-containing protein [Noviherbaspirillum saxi]